MLCNDSEPVSPLYFLFVCFLVLMRVNLPHFQMTSLSVFTAQGSTFNPAVEMDFSFNF